MAKVKIEIVEDEAITARDLQNMLTELGYDVVAIASSGEVAIKKTEENQPDLVLMDILLKGNIDGIEAAELIHERFDIPVVYVTAYMDKKQLEKTKASGSYGYITKPFEDKSVLRSTIEIALQRHKLEKRLRNAEQNWYNSFNALDDVMLIIDRDYNIEKMNEIGLKLLGKSKEEVIGQKCYRVISGADSPGEDCPCRKSLETKKVESIDRYEDRFGKYFSVMSSPIFDENGEIIKFVDLRRDITERKRAEEQQKLLLHAAESSIDGLAMGDLEGRITYVNDAFVKMFGYSREELIGNEIALFYPKDQLPKLEKALKATMAGGWIGELVGKRKNGERFPIAISSSIVKDDEGNVIAHMASHEDISERKRAELELANALRERRDIMETVPDIIYVLDMNGKLIRWNSKLAVFTGLSSGELMGRHALEFIFEEDREITAEAIREAYEKGQAEIEMSIIRKDGTPVPHHWTAALLKDEQGNAIGITGIGRDISERKRREDELKKKNEDLELFNRLAVGRELKMIELKKEVNSLLKELGKEPRYEIVGEGEEKGWV